MSALGVMSGHRVSSTCEYEGNVVGGDLASQLGHEHEDLHEFDVTVLGVPVDVHVGDHDLVRNVVLHFV